MTLDTEQEHILDSIFTFKIGDVVRPKAQEPGYNREGQRLSPQRLVIVERLLQQCYGGVQCNYLARAHSMANPGYFGSEAGYSFTLPLIQLTQPELMLAEPLGLTAERQPRKRPSSLDEPPPGEGNGDSEPTVDQ
jgi:hypothetical protein